MPQLDNIDLSGLPDQITPGQGTAGQGTAIDLSGLPDQGPAIDLEGLPDQPIISRESDSWAEVVGKSVMQGLTFIPSSLGAAMRFQDDLLGIERPIDPTTGETATDLYDLSKDAREFWQPRYGESAAKRHTSDIVRTVTEMTSTMALTGGAGLLPTMSAGAGAQKYQEAREAGLGMFKAFEAGTTQGVLEYGTEKIPIGVLLKPSLGFGRRLAVGMITDIPGELMATAGEMALIDERMLGRRYTLDQYLTALKDTAITAAGVTGTMTTITHPFVKEIEDFQKEVEKDPEGYEETFRDGLAQMQETRQVEPIDLTEEVTEVTDLMVEEGMTAEKAKMEAEKLVARVTEARRILNQEEVVEAPPTEPVDLTEEVAADQVTEQIEEIAAEEEVQLDAIVEGEEVAEAPPSPPTALAIPEVGEQAELPLEEPTETVEPISAPIALPATLRYIAGDKALSVTWTKAKKAAQKAHKAGKTEEAARWKAKMAEVARKANEKIAAIRTEKQKMAKRRRTVRIIKEYLGLTDAQLTGLTKRRNIGNMTDYEFKRFKDDLLIRAERVQETAIAKARVMETIQRKRLEKVENYRKSLDLPPMRDMTIEQLDRYEDLLETFAEGDVFLSERELETVDRTDLKGIRVWREARERMAAEIGVPVEDLEKIIVSEFDDYRWDTALAERNPFYKMMVEETTRLIMNAEAQYHAVENEVFRLAKASEKSRGRSITRALIPQDKEIFAYLEASEDVQPTLAAEMTPEQLDFAHYMREYFGEALEYLIKTKSLGKGRENYFTHIRRSFLESLKEDGLGKAILSVFKRYELDEAVFNILDEDTGNILPLEKFFQFSMRRSGNLDPSFNVTRAFLTYVKTMEKKKSLDELIPKLDIYAQALTPTKLTPRGLEVDRSIKKFVNKYINNKKGRKIRWISKQGGKVDLIIRATRSFVTMLDLGFSIPIGSAAFLGEQMATYEMLGLVDYAKSARRKHTKQGRAILKKYEHFTRRSPWQEFTAPGKEITERVHEAAFGLFHQSAVTANKDFLLGVMTKKEFQAGELSEERLAQIKLEMGRFRAIPGTKSLVGSTTAGGVAVMYKSWAIAIGRTLTKDFTTFVKDLKAKPVGEAFKTREFQELRRLVSTSAIVLIVLSTLGDDEDDRGFTGQLVRKLKREALTLMSGLDPTIWLSTPRAVTWVGQVAINLKRILLLEEYKTKPGLKGVEGLKKQFTPAPLRGLEAEKTTRR